MIRGIDISAVQGNIDWTAVAAGGIQFVIVKCSTGNDPGVDPDFAQNVAGARAAGVAVGGYHFGYPLPADPNHPNRDPAGQAALAFQKFAGLGTAAGALPPVLDLEWPAVPDWRKWGCNASQILAWGLAFLQAAEALWGVKPFVYSYPDFLKQIHVEDEPGYADYPLWMAAYAHYPKRTPPGGASPIVPAPWNDWALWQHSGNALPLPGSKVIVDYDVLNGALSDWVRGG